MTVKEFLETHRPNNFLCIRLRELLAQRRIFEQSEILIGSGIVSNKKQSRFYKMEQEAAIKFGEYIMIVGGRAGKEKSRGHKFIAVSKKVIDSPEKPR